MVIYFCDFESAWLKFMNNPG